MTWWSASLADIERELATDFHFGLRREEAWKRLEIHGLNQLPAGKVDSLPIIFLRQFQSPLIYILLGASIVVYQIGESTDSFIILFVLLFNAVVGTIQEGKSQNTLLALKKFAETTADVIRDGEEIIISDSTVVPGDIIILQEGGKVPADARIIESRALRVDEAALTGESVPVHKKDAIIEDVGAPPAARVNTVFKGTYVTSGNGRAVVMATGLNTEIGKISATISVIDTEIPLKKDIRYLSRLIIITVLTISASLFSVGIFLGKTVREMFATVVSLSVSIIPEGLPIILTLVLAMGVSRMAKRNALVKKLQAVEALGQTRVIAVDKTGTITRNEMVIREVVVRGTVYTISGDGYDPQGEVRLKGDVIDPANHPDLILAGKIAAFCAAARAVFSEETSSWRVTGDPTEAAAYVFAEKIGFHKDDLERESPLIAEAPFDYKTKYHATSHREGNSQFVTVAGAPESVFAVSKKYLAADGIHMFTKDKVTQAEEIFNGMSRRGLRVVAFAYAETKLPRDAAARETIALENLVFAGFFGMEDSLRPEVPDALSRARAAGIKVVMITGDYRLTAVAIAKEAGIWREGDAVLTDADVENMSDGELAAAFDTATVFARITPEHKMKIIQTYRRRGEIIAMTGDGVNDAPSLVAADLGVAMGKIGTEVAKEAADIVLLDDNFCTIVSAIEEGRAMYKTIKKAILFLISTSVGEVLSIAGAIVLGFPLPILPAQILWLNLVTDPFVGAALAFEPKEDNLLKGNFGSRGRHLIDATIVVRTIVMAIPMMLGTLFIFSYEYGNLPKAWTMTLTTLAIFQWLNGWNCRSEDKSIFEMNPFSNPALIAATGMVIVLQLFAVYNPIMQGILHTTALSLGEWFFAVCISFSIIAAEETRKLVYRKWIVRTQI